MEMETEMQIERTQHNFHTHTHNPTLSTDFVVKGYHATTYDWEGTGLQAGLAEEGEDG